MKFKQIVCFCMIFVFGVPAAVAMQQHTHSRNGSDGRSTSGRTALMRHDITYQNLDDLLDSKTSGMVTEASGRRLIDVDTSGKDADIAAAPEFPITCPLCGTRIDSFERAIGSNEFCKIPSSVNEYFHVYCALSRLLLPYKTDLSDLLKNRDWPQVDLYDVIKRLHDRHAIITLEEIDALVNKTRAAGYGITRPWRRRADGLNRGLALFEDDILGLKSDIS